MERLFRHVANLLRHEPRARDARYGLAGWVGRNLARLSYSILVEPTWLEVNRLDVRIPGLPEQALRIVQLSDIHFKRSMPAGYVARCIELANQQEGHLITLTGDFVHKGYAHVRTVAEHLRHLYAPLGVYAVLGNHDFSVRNALGLRRYPGLHRAISAALEDVGVRVLRNETVHVEHFGTRVALIGVDDVWSRSCDLQRAFRDADPDAPRVVLAHNPSTVELLGGRRFDLMLSGHTHGGQIHFPGIGSPTLSRRMRQYAAGLYSLRGGFLYVNKGIGYGLRIRYNRRPEVAVLDLSAPVAAAKPA